MISTSAVASATIIEEPTYGTKAVNYSSASASMSFSDGTAMFWKNPGNSWQNNKNFSASVFTEICKRQLD